MVNETIKNVDLLTTPLFQKNMDFQRRYPANGCLKVLRFLLFLDACHDFLESSPRNKRWAENTDNSGKNLKVVAHEKLLVNLKNDLVWINILVPSTNWIEKDVQIDKLIISLLKLAETKANVSSKKNIKSKFVDLIQKIVNIKDIDISKYVQDFTINQYSDFILPLIEPAQYHNNIFVGVDADYYSGSYAPLFRSLDGVIKRPNTDIRLFTSPATSYDAASEGLVTREIGQMLKNQGKVLNTLGDKHKGNYKIQLTLGTTVIASVTYGLKLSISGGKAKDFHVIRIDKFFSKNNIVTPPQINSNTNSVKFLVDNFSPHDDIFLFKTFGDFGQILSFRSESQLIPNYVSIFISFDFLSATISSLFNKSTLLESLDTGVNNLSIYTLDFLIMDRLTKKVKELGLGGVAAAQILTGISKIPINPKSKQIKKKSISVLSGKKLKYGLSLSNLKEKLKSVGIRVTKDVNGKRKSLTEKELIKRAESFKKLQLKAKQKGIKIKTSKGKFKSKKSLEKELRKNKPKNNKPKKNKPKKNNFG